MYWKQWLKSLLSLVILLGILEMLLPFGELAKFAKLVLGLVLMLAVLQPLSLLLNQDIAVLDLTWDFQREDPEVQVLADRIRWVATEPFLEQNEAALATQLEAALLGLEVVQEAKVHVQNQGQRTALIEVQLVPYNANTKLQVEQFISTMLNLPANKIQVRAWSD